MSNGWTLGKDGFYHVNPKWKNPEETFTLPKKSVMEEATVVMEGEEEGMVDSRKMALKRETEEKPGMVEMKIEKPAQKKSSSTLGPKGLKKCGGKDNYAGFRAFNYSQEDVKVGGLALVLKNMKKEGYGPFPEDFKPPLFESKKTYSYVRQDLYTTVTMSCYKLADCRREGIRNSCLNPFAEGVPFGERQPLPE